MSLTPQDIQKQKFSTKFRGFDVDEVDAFLEEVADSFLVLIQENNKLKEQTAILEAREAAQKNDEQTFKAAMIAAQKLAEEMKEKARKEAAALLANAQDEADVLQAEANMRVEKARAELEELNTMAERVRAELRAILTSYLDLLGGEHKLAAEPAAAKPERIVAKAAKLVAATTAVAAAALATQGPASKKAEEMPGSSKELDEQTLTALFRESAARPGERGPAGDAGETEELADLFERMEIPDAITGEEERTIEELTTDMLFSEGPADDEGAGPDFKIAEENEETTAARRPRSP